MLPEYIHSQLTAKQFMNNMIRFWDESDNITYNQWKNANKVAEYIGANKVFLNKKGDNTFLLPCGELIRVSRKGSEIKNVIRCRKRG